MSDFEKRKGRLIVVDGKKWKWQISSRLGVVAYSETGEKKYAHADEVTGAEVRRGQYKRSSDGCVTPKHIKLWIKGTQFKGVARVHIPRNLEEQEDYDW